MKQVDKISSMAEYFILSEKYNFKNFISRGEPFEYEEITASAFRPYNQYKHFFGKPHLDELYKQVGNELTDMQKEHFLAFAQHSGLPTYLIDFTMSPLISLFFACNSEGENNQSGFVHFINKHRLWSMDDIVTGTGYIDIIKQELVKHWAEEFDIDKTGKYFDYDHSSFLFGYQKMINSFLDLLISPKDDFCQSSLYKSIYNLCKDLKGKEYAVSDKPRYIRSFSKLSFNQLNEDIFATIQKIFRLFSSSVETIEDVIWEKRIQERIGFDYQDICLKKLKNRYDDELYENINCEFISWEDGLNLLIDLAITFSQCSAKGNFNLPFYGTYSPPNISGRVLVQNSVFVCQLYHMEMFSENEPNPWNLLLTQLIEPDITVEILNKKQILNELDGVGINLKTVFGDHDNIARYIKNSFYHGISSI